MAATTTAFTISTLVRDGVRGERKGGEGGVRLRYVWTANDFLLQIGRISGLMAALRYDRFSAAAKALLMEHGFSEVLFI